MDNPCSQASQRSTSCTCLCGCVCVSHPAPQPTPQCVPHLRTRCHTRPSYIIQQVLGPLTSSQMELFLRNPRFVGLKFPDMTRPETLQKKYMGKLSKRALNFMRVIPNLT